MADSFTVNYGWTKPDIGASDDTWGDKWNANLDGIDAQIRAGSDKTGVPEAPDNQTYGRAAGAWNLVVPAAGGTFTGPVGLSAGGAVTGGGLTFVGSAALSVPGPAQFTLGGGSAGWALTTDGAGTLSWSPVATGGPYVPLSGATMTGPLIMQGSNMIALSSPLASGQSAIIGQKAGVNRWQLMIGDYTAEGLNNVGSNFSLVAFSTTGATLGTWLTIARADGSTNLNGAVVNVAGSMSINGVLLVSNVGNLSVPGGTAGQFLQTNGSGVLSWATPAGGGGGVPEAPNDSTSYARRVTSGVGAWTHLTHTDITDWTASLAGYALTTAVPVASAALPIMDGTANAGSSAAFARGDHVHPTDTSRAAVSALPPASTTTPLADGTAAVGTSTAYARADHVHPSDAYPHDNRIINGDMRIDQRNAGASGTGAAVYTVDRWFYGASQTSKGTWQRGGGAGSLAIGFGNFLTFTSSSAYASVAADNFNFHQRIEADMVSDFAWGTPNAQPVTLSFWVSSSLTGTFSGAVANEAQTRCYPFSYSIPTVSVWTKIVITIPGDTAGTWVMSGNASAMRLFFDLGAGSTFRGPAGAWASTTYVGVTGAVSIVGTNAASLTMTGVKLEIGSVATPFNRQSLAKSMADCERYFRWVPFNMAFNAAAASMQLTTQIPFSPAMRAAPTLSTLGPDPNVTGPTSTNNANNAVDTATAYGARAFLQATAAGLSSVYGFRVSANAEL